MWAAHHLPLKEASQGIRKTYDIQVTVAKNAKEEPLSRSKKLSYKAIFQGKYRARTFSSFHHYGYSKYAVLCTLASISQPFPRLFLAKE